MSKRKFSLRRLFSNKKFLFVFSIVFAFIFWIVVALEYAPIVENVIEDVPVTIDMENSVPDKFGLQIFGSRDFTVSIVVKGSRYIVGGNLLNANDFEATAQTAYVNSSGSHTLPVKVTPKNPESEFEIVSVSNEFIEVYFDKAEEKEITVEPRFVSELSSYTGDGYLFNEDDVIMPVSTVKISGAKTIVDKVTKAYADISIDTRLTESETLDVPVVPDNLTDRELSLVKISGSDSFKLPITLPVYKISTLPVSVSFKDIPPSYIDAPLEYTCTPSRVRVAVLQDGGENESSLEAGTISFKNISPTSNVFEFSTDEIKNVKILDSTKKISVRVDVRGFFATALKPDNTISVSVENTENYKIDFSSLGNITVVGNSASLPKIKSSDILLSYNTDDVEVGNTPVSVPVTLTLKGSSDCWIFGEYNVKISL